MIALELGVDYSLGFAGQKFWNRAGIEKIIAAGLWKREFSRGKFGSPDAELKTQPPSVDAVLAMAAKPAAPAAAPAASSRRSIIPTAAPVTPKQQATFSPAEIAAKTNGKKGPVGHGWDETIAELNRNK